MVVGEIRVPLRLPLLAEVELKKMWELDISFGLGGVERNEGAPSLPSFGRGGRRQTSLATPPAFALPASPHPSRSRKQSDAESLCRAHQEAAPETRDHRFRPPPLQPARYSTIQIADPATPTLSAPQSTPGILACVPHLPKLSRNCCAVLDYSRVVCAGSESPSLPPQI